MTILRLIPLLLVTALALPLAGAAGVDYDVGASGRCYDEGELDDVRTETETPAGGETALILRNNDVVTAVTSFDPTDAAYAVAALVFDPGAPAEGKGCSSETNTDFVEAHAYVSADNDGEFDPGEGAQVCYDGDLNGPCYTPPAPEA